MKPVHFKIPLYVALGISIPLLTMAQFKGPKANMTPPAGNVPGVIWNMYGTGQTQSNAEINISGGAQIGGNTIFDGEVVSNKEAKLVGGTTISSDVRFQTDKAIRVDKNGPATFWMGNWGGAAPETQKPLSFSVNGDVYAYAIGPNGAGQEGRVQADKFCFHPGGANDCVTSWGGLGGDFVKKTGDTMSGTLKVNGLNQGGIFSGATYGVQSTSPNVAMYGVGDIRGGYFSGGSYAVDAVTKQAGVGTAVRGMNGLVGGGFTGTETGVKASGKSVGVEGISNTIGGKFSHSNPNGGRVQAGMVDTGLLAVGSAKAAIFQNAGDVNNTVQIGITDNQGVKIGVDSNYPIRTNGDLIAPNNTLSNCVWTAYVADNSPLLCPAATPILNGVQRSGASTRGYCCKI